VSSFPSQVVTACLTPTSFANHVVINVCKVMEL